VDPATAIGIAFAIISLLLGMILEGGNPVAFIQPTAAMIVFGGTTGVLIASSGIKPVMSMFKLTLVSMKYKGKAIDKPDVLRTIGRMADKARREGLLALEDEAESISDPFIKKGIGLVVDGTDPELVKDILESDLDAMEARHAQQSALFQNAGGFAPTLGIIGTVMGLVHVLENLSNPDTLGPAISMAFIATFYGVASANLYYLPVGNKLKKISHEEVHARTMIIEGIVSIQAGDNPRVVEEKLRTFLTPAEREAFDAAAGTSDDAESPSLAKAA
jgi:chemotaxis protein MotA